METGPSPATGWGPRVAFLALLRLNRISIPIRKSVEESRQGSVKFLKEVLPWLDQEMLALENHS